MMTCGPPLLVLGFILLRHAEVLTAAEVWRFSVLMLFLCFPRTCAVLVEVFICRELADHTVLRECPPRLLPRPSLCRRLQRD